MEPVRTGALAGSAAHLRDIPHAPAARASRGMLRIGGERLVRHQLSLALAAGCRRIICVSCGFGPELAEIQHDAEQAGASFHVTTGSTGLPGLITAADEVLVIVDGLLATTGDALRLLEAGQGVFVQPAETGIPAGFERIDLNHASAGLMLIHGGLIDRLMDLPPDVDPASALLRIALQAGTPQRALPDSVRLGGHWLLIRDEDEAQAAEDGWINRHLERGPRTPGPMLARFLVRRFGPAMLHGGASAHAGIAAALLLVAAGLAITTFGHAGPGLLLAGAGWVVCRAASLLDRLQRESLASSTGQAWREPASAIVFDLGLIAILSTALAAPSVVPESGVPGIVFAPAMLVGLIRLVPRIYPGNGGHWVADRLALCGLLAMFAFGQVLDIGVPALAVLLLFAALILPREPVRKSVSAAHEITRA